MRVRVCGCGDVANVQVVDNTESCDNSFVYRRVMTCILFGLFGQRDTG